MSMNDLQLMHKSLLDGPSSFEHPISVGDVQAAGSYSYDTLLQRVPILRYSLRCVAADPSMFESCGPLYRRHKVLAILIILVLSSISIISEVQLISDVFLSYPGHEFIVIILTLLYTLSIIIGLTSLSIAMYRIVNLSHSPQLLHLMNRHLGMLARSTWRHGIAMSCMVIILLVSMTMVYWQATFRVFVALYILAVWTYLIPIVACFTYYLICKCHQNDVQQLIDRIGGGSPFDSIESMFSHFHQINSHLEHTSRLWSWYLATAVLSSFSLTLVAIVSQLLFHPFDSSNSVILSFIFLFLPSYVPTFFIIVAMMRVNHRIEFDLPLAISRYDKLSCQDRSTLIDR